MQAWNCSGSARTFITLAAAPKGRECVVMLHMAANTEADKKSAQHILDTFEADCGGIS